MTVGSISSGRCSKPRSKAAHDRPGESPWFSSLLVAVLLGVFFAQAVSSALLKSPTFDEEFHVARAYAYVRTGDLRMQQNHPPLVSVLSGLPLLLMPELTPPEEIPHWDDAFLFHFADSLFWRLGYDVDKMLFLARFPIILLGTVLGAFVYRWARGLYGPGAGLLAAGLYAFAPNLLAHTRLVTTDMAVTACVFIALYAFWCYLRQPTIRRLVLVGLAVGLALTAKLSALLLLPVLVILALLAGLRRAGRGPRAAGRCLSVICPLSFIVLVAGLVVWAFYRFEVRPWPGTALPLPATTYLLNVRTLIGHAERGHGAFLMGRVSTHGWWYYFPVTFLLKTPLLMLLLLGISVWDTVRRRRWREEVPLLLFPVTMFGFALVSSLNIGYRYILPIDPFLIVYAARVAGLAWAWPARIRRAVLPGLMVIYVGVSLWLYPHYLAFFNLLAGGPDGGYRYLVDSNLDWGQDLKLLKSYLDKQNVDEVWLGYLGTADPGYYGIRYRPLFAPDAARPAEGFFPIHPAPGWYVIGATVLQGPYALEPDILDWFRRQEPVARIGHSMFVYRVAPDPNPPTWLGMCYTPERVLSDRDIVRRFGTDDLRVVGFDCQQAWVYPAGDEPGWYLVPLPSDGPGTLARQLLDGATVVYRDRGLREGMGYTVYRWHASPEPGAVAPVGEAWASPALAPAEGDQVVPIAVPADLGGQVDFLSYHLSSEAVVPGGDVVVDTAWRVTARPEEPPLSVFVHLLSPAGALSAGDGLGFPAIQWVPGDVFIQRNRLPVPRGVPPGRYWVQVGLYSLATGERLPVSERGYVVADRLLLSPVTVQEPSAR